MNLPLQKFLRSADMSGEEPNSPSHPSHKCILSRVHVASESSSSAPAAEDLGPEEADLEDLASASPAAKWRAVGGSTVGWGE